MYSENDCYIYSTKLNCGCCEFSYVLGSSGYLHHHILEAHIVSAGEQMVSRLLHAGRREVKILLVTKVEVALTLSRYDRYFVLDLCHHHAEKLVGKVILTGSNNVPLMQMVYEMSWESQCYCLLPHVGLGHPLSTLVH